MIDDILYSLLYVLFFFLTGIILIVVGFLKHRREEKFEKCGIKTRGVIHDLVGDVEAGYYAVFILPPEMVKEFMKNIVRKLSMEG